MTSLDFTIIMPEALLAGYALLALLAGAYFGKDRIAGTLMWTTVAVFLLLAFYIGIGRGSEGAAFFDMYVADGFARFCKILILASAAAVLAHPRLKSPSARLPASHGAAISSSDSLFRAPR